MKFIQTKSAPKAIGPYSQAVAHNGLLFVSGQIALDPESMNLVEGGIKEQTLRVLENLNAILDEAGVSREDVLKVTIYLSDMNDFSELNKLYENFFGNHKPARATVEVSRLPMDVLLEIDCIASAG